MRLKKIGVSLGLLSCLLGFSLRPAMSQDQQIFQDTRQMEVDSNQQVNALEEQKEQYMQQMQATQAKDGPYKLYAEQRIHELQKLKAAGGSPSRSYAKQTGELYALQNWLKADEATKEAEQRHIQQLDQSIANLRDSEVADRANMSGAIQSMRESEIDKKADDDFNKMMRVNQFNELQSEMGAASWGRPPTDGTYNSTGGYGMGGGYGYSPFMGRRW